ncbi:MAG: nucleotidyltransferase family protein [Planctomycetota bacterium]
MDRHVQFAIPADRIVDFCRRHHIRKLAFFGSVLRDDFGPDSDVDVLVEFEPGHVPGFGFIRIQDELSSLLGRPVDLVTYKALNRRLRDHILNSSQVQYEQP